MCLALRERIFVHGPGDGVVVLGEVCGFTHAFHRDVRCLSAHFAYAQDDKSELNKG